MDVDSDGENGAAGMIGVAGATTPNEDGFFGSSSSESSITPPDEEGSGLAESIAGAPSREV